MPIERLQRIRARARTTLLAPERMQRGYADVAGRAAFANQDQGLAALEGNLQLIAVYGYDPFNRRVIRHVVGELPRYSTWDGWREVAEHVWGGNGWLTFQAYVWGGRIDELLRFSRKVGETWQHFHPQQDHQDSVDLLVGADGAPKEKYEYDPFGGVTVFTWNGTAWVNPTGGSPLGNPYAYTGRRLDGETGLMYYRNRYYWPLLGRFVTGDPFGLWGDDFSVGSPYCYVGNAPNSFSDPLGLQVGGARGSRIRNLDDPSLGDYARLLKEKTDLYRSKGGEAERRLRDIKPRIDSFNRVMGWLRTQGFGNPDLGKQILDRIASGAVQTPPGADWTVLLDFINDLGKHKIDNKYEEFKKKGAALVNDAKCLTAEIERIRKLLEEFRRLQRLVDEEQARREALKAKE